MYSRAFFLLDMNHKVSYSLGHVKSYGVRGEYRQIRALVDVQERKEVQILSAPPIMGDAG